jgi:hypothetical protein
VQPEIEIPVGMARNNKQTSVKNRRMNPPRPALSNSETVPPEPVGKLRLQANFPSPSLLFAILNRSFFTKEISATRKKGHGIWENTL